MILRIYISQCEKKLSCFILCVYFLVRPALRGCYFCHYLSRLRRGWYSPIFSKGVSWTSSFGMRDAYGSFHVYIFSFSLAICLRQIIRQYSPKVQRTPTESPLDIVLGMQHSYGSFHLLFLFFNYIATK